METYVSTWNAEGKSSEEIDKVLASFDFKLNKETPHIICVQQAKFPLIGPFTCGVTDNFRWICSGEFGSAVLIDKKLDSKSTSFKQICENICVAEFVFEPKKLLTVISCYIPPPVDNTTEEHWSELTDIFKSISCTVAFVLAGDFSGAIGKEDFPPDVHIGVVGENLFQNKTSENGFRLIKLATSIHAQIVNTFGKCNPYSYTYDDGTMKRQQSFIMVPLDRIQHEPSGGKIWRRPFYKHDVLSQALGVKLPSLDAAESRASISLWNVKGASHLAIDKALNELTLPVVCVQNLFLTSETDVETKNYKWFTSKKIFGENVGILIRTSSPVSMDDFKVVSECLCTGNMTLNESTFKVICCFVPPHTNSARFQEVTETLMDAVKAIPEETLLVVAGNFNADFNAQDDQLIDDVCDRNTFLQRFFKNFKLYSKAFDINNDSALYAAKLNKTCASCILVSTSCALRYPTVRNDLLIQCVPLVEKRIISVVFIGPGDSELELVPSRKVRDKIEEPDHLNSVRNIQDCVLLRTPRPTIPVLRGDKDWTTMARQESDLPLHMCLEFEHTSPADTVLKSILGDKFVLYNGFTEEGSVCTGAKEMLGDSFNALLRGSIVMELLDDWHVSGKLNKKSVRFKWNGITVHEENDSYHKSFDEITLKAQTSFIRKLGYQFHTVRAKRTYYNNGLPPKCEDKEKLDKARRVMKRSEFPSPPISLGCKDLHPFVRNFFMQEENTDLELVFGNDFSVKEFNRIKKYPKRAREVGFRYLKSTAEVNGWDGIATFVRRSPWKIRDLLMKTDDRKDARFYVIPPCPAGADYNEWCNKWTKEHFPEEMPTADTSRLDVLDSVGAKQRQGIGTMNKKLKPARVKPSFSWQQDDHHGQSQSSVQARVKPSFSWQQDDHHGQSQSSVQDIVRPEATTTSKRLRMEVAPPRGKVPWGEVVLAETPLVVIWPLDISSNQEPDLRKVLEFNFPTQFSPAPSNRVAVHVTFPMRAKGERTFCVCSGDNIPKAAKEALDTIISHSSLIKYKKKYAPLNGLPPDFVRYSVPCQTKPRTYILLNKETTGLLTEDSVVGLFDAFKPSKNEDMFFDKDSYSREEKLLLLDLAPKHYLKVRHFGYDHLLENRYVCVYKAKSKDEILEEVLRLRDLHPKYEIVINRLPAHLKYNTL